METNIDPPYRIQYNSEFLTYSQDEHNPQATSVQNFAYKEHQNHRFRPYMEDSHKILDPFLNDPCQGFFAVFDGHGGSEAVDYCKLRFHEEFKKCLLETPEDIQHSFIKCFDRLDSQIRLTGAITSGSTATIALVKKEKSEQVLYIGNVGDSSAVLITAEGVERLTEVHRGDNPDEIDRVLNSGGTLIRGRVGGQLAVTRALGDFHLKNRGVISEPFVNRVEVPLDALVVMASDGVWDYVDERELSEFWGRKSVEVAERLLEKALEGGSQDNICVLAVCL